MVNIVNLVDIDPNFIPICGNCRQPLRQLLEIPLEKV